MKKLLSERYLILLSFGVIYFVWGSTFLVNWIAIRYIPPFLMVGCRFVLGGALLYVFSRMMGGKKPSFEHWKNALFMGTLFMTFGAGMLVWAEQWIDSGIAAVFIAFEPLIVVFFVWYMRNRPPTFRIMTGTCLGIIGIIMLVAQDDFMSNENTVKGVIAIFVSIVAWAYATVKIAELEMPEYKALGAGMQMVCGGVVLLVMSFLSGETAGFDILSIPFKAVYAWLYLTFFGGILGFSAFNYLLIKSTPEKVATAGYVNPIVALILGWGLNNEHMSNQSLIATVILLTGVVLINTKKGFLKKKS